MRKTKTQVVLSVIDKVINKVKLVGKLLSTTCTFQGINHPEHAVRLMASRADRCGLAVAA